MCYLVTTLSNREISYQNSSDIVDVFPNLSTHQEGYQYFIVVMHTIVKFIFINSKLSLAPLFLSKCDYLPFLKARQKC